MCIVTSNCYKLSIKSPFIKDSSLLLNCIQTYLSLSVVHFQARPFVDVEVALRMMYLAGEAVTDKVYSWTIIIYVSIFGHAFA